jgi:hypothetical protein
VSAPTTAAAGAAASALAFFARFRGTAFAGGFTSGRGGNSGYGTDRSGFGGFGGSSGGFRFGSGLHGGPGLARFTGAAITVASTIPISPAVTVAIAILAHGALVAGYLVEVVVLFEEVGNVEKRVAFEAHIDESRLHSRQDARDAPLMNAACERIFVGALEVNFHQLIVFNESYFGLMPVG